MRVTSTFFVSALTRRVFAAGGFAAVEKRGADEAGAIFIRLVGRDGRVSLYAPAPQTSAAEVEQAPPGGRLFEARLSDAVSDEAAALLERERRFDPDLWIVDLEIDTPGDLFAVVAAS